MKFLFIHQNFPGQFVHLAPALAARGHQVVALSSRVDPPPLAGVATVRYQLVAETAGKVGAVPQHVRELEAKYQRGRAVADALMVLSRQGFTPDVVFAHSGWGEALFVKDVLPHARLIVYAELYYNAHGQDCGFDPEFPAAADQAIHTRIKNTALLHSLVAADAAISPTAFQRDAHPLELRHKIEVIHDGIDTDRFAPDATAILALQRQGRRLQYGDEVVSFVARNLEPYRGYHILMRALPRLMALRPQARIVIVGGSEVSYGARAPRGTTWRKLFFDEVKDRIDPSRIHFVGRVKHETLTRLLQISAAHIYLTYPFVLSWSMLEAMSIGGLVIGSRTAPVEELITNGHNGRLVDFFAPETLADTVAECLAAPEQFAPLRRAARQTILEHYDLRRQCLPKLLKFVLD